MKSSSLKMIAEGIPKPREYRDAIIHDWHLAENHRQHLHLYMILQTSPEEFFFHLKDGEIKVKNKMYSVTWLNTPDNLRESKAGILVSLRYCKYLERGYILVKRLVDGQFNQLEY